MVTMLLGRLWHGTNWTFVVWGALHGFYLWIEKIILDIRKVPAALTSSSTIVLDGNGSMQLIKNKTLGNFMLAMVTFFFINVTWIFFRSPDFTSAWKLLTSMLSYGPKAEVLLTTLSIIKVFVIIILLVAFH